MESLDIEKLRDDLDTQRLAQLPHEEIRHIMVQRMAMADRRFRENWKKAHRPVTRIGRGLPK